MVKTLSAREAFELHKSAVTRDFVAKPRLGMLDSSSMGNAPFTSILTVVILTPTFPLSSLLDYRTVTGVNGPLVILDNVKVKQSKSGGG
jgi:V-type H+-transporting ATPase subunit B